MIIFFWIATFIVFYTYIGYGILLYILVKIKEQFIQPKKKTLPNELPDVTLLIAAYNEEDIVKEKMLNCYALTYPKNKLKIVWITDGTTDTTNELLAQYSDITTLFDPKRGGKAAAFNRAMPFIKTPLVVYTDANTMLCKEAIAEIVKEFTDPKVGCVAGEKRVAIKEKQDATAGEGIYWKYESTLKSLDYRLYSAVGAAGELFAIRTHLFIELPSDTLLDDFILSLKIATKGYKIAYCKEAYAVEDSSANIKEEAKRKVRISAGGLQSIGRLKELLNIFRYGILSFQYISHRVLRWSVTPILLFLLLPANIAIVFSENNSLFYELTLLFQLIFYIVGIYGYKISSSEIKSKFVFVPYYFLFMNVNVIKGAFYLKKYKGKGTWEKVKRNTNKAK